MKKGKPGCVLVFADLGGLIFPRKRPVMTSKLTLSTNIAEKHEGAMSTRVWIDLGAKLSEHFNDVVEIRPRVVKKEDVLTHDPMCIFCGGESQSEDIEHAPSKSVFRHGERKASHLFGACKRCNGGRSSDDNVVGMLLRSAGEDANQLDQKEVAKLLTGNRYGAGKTFVFADAEMTSFESSNGAQEKRRMLVHPRAHFQRNRWLAKVSAALWYLHMGEILPVGASIHISTRSAWDGWNSGFYPSGNTPMKHSSLYDEKNPHPNEFEYYYCDSGDVMKIVLVIRNAISATVEIRKSERRRGLKGIDGYFHISENGIKPMGLRHYWGDVNPNKYLGGVSALRGSASFIAVSAAKDGPGRPDRNRSGLK